MQLQFPPDTEAFVRNRAQAAGFASVEDYIRNLVLHEEAGAAVEGKLSEEEMASSLAMIDRSMEEVKNGGGRPAKEALREIATELGLKLDR